MDDLPELPFKKVISYLSLEERLKARAVSRYWCHMIDNSRVKTLCFSEKPSGFNMEKSRWVIDAFAQNFISSSRIKGFFDTYGHSILSNLKHLRLCVLAFKTKGNDASTFIPTLNLFSQLEELDIIRFTYPDAASGLDGEVELHLPLLTSIHLELVNVIDQLTLDTPRLKKVKLHHCSSLKLELVHADSVEWLATDVMAYVKVKNLKSLKYLYCGPASDIDATLLSGLENVKEVHTMNRVHVSSLFEQKQRYSRTDMKIFLWGFLLSGPDDPAIDSLSNPNSVLVHLVKNPSRLADDIPLWTNLAYSAFGGVSPGSENSFLSKLTDLKIIRAESRIPSQNVQRFLNVLKNVPNIISLQFFEDQPQDLFDRLPEHSAVQHLIIDRPVSDLRFLFRLEHLFNLQYSGQMNADMVRKLVEDLQFLSFLKFKHLNKQVEIEIDPFFRLVISMKEENTVAHLWAN